MSAIPGDYQERILEAYRKLDAAYSDAEEQGAKLERQLGRAKELTTGATTPGPCTWHDGLPS